MDLLEYQGKQLFARHGVPVPSGAPATTVEEAVAAADEIGYPCVVKAQVQIGGRGKAGGIKVAQNRAGGRGALQGHPRHGHPRPHGPRGLDRGGVRHRRGVLRVDRLRPLGQAPARHALARRAAWTSRRSRRRTRPRSPACTSTRCSASRTSTRAAWRSRPASTPTSSARSARCCAKLYDAFVNEEAMLVEVNPLIVSGDRSVDGARREGHARRQRAVPPPGQRRAAQRRGRGRAGADGARARPHVRQARRQRRHPRQRRRPRDVHARRRRPGRRRPANFLDAGGGSKAEAITAAVEVILSNENVTAVLFNIFGGITRCDEVAKGLIEAFDQIKPTVPFVVRLDGTNDKEGRALLAEANLPERPHGGDHARTPPRRSWSWPADGDPRQQGHEALRLRHHRPRGHLPHAQQPQLRDQRRLRASRPARAARTSRASRCSTRSTTRSPRPARTRR